MSLEQLHLTVAIQVDGARRRKNTRFGVVITMLISQQNMDMVVGGDPDALDYDITADQYKFELQDVVDGDV
ncbi:MAG: hypothetical protein AAFX99_28125, partial [Myxococcota bacterium]